jgi:hypothetical protein
MLEGDDQIVPIADHDQIPCGFDLAPVMDPQVGMVRVTTARQISTAPAKSILALALLPAASADRVIENI